MQNVIMALTITTVALVLNAAPRPAHAEENSAQPLIDPRIPYTAKSVPGTVQTEDEGTAALTPIRSLDDPQNPYCNQYQEWDRWMYDHYCSEQRARELQSQTADRRHYFAYDVWVDQDGFQVPWVMSSEQAAASSALVIDWKSTARASTYLAYSAELPDFFDAMQQAGLRAAALYYPPIPQWLADAPPVYALLMPDGEVVCRGEPGSGRDAPWQPQATGFYYDEPGPSPAWIRYDASGHELARLQVNQDWWTLYFPDWTEKFHVSPYFSGYAAGASEAVRGVAFDPAYVNPHGHGDLLHMLPKEAVVWYNYRGAIVDAKWQPPHTGRIYLPGLDGREIPALYAAQQALAHGSDAEAANGDCH